MAAQTWNDKRVTFEINPTMPWKLADEWVFCHHFKERLILDHEADH